jgi:fructosamine-3-kinase
MIRLWIALEHHVYSVTRQPFIIRQRQLLGGGCINQASRISDGQRTFQHIKALLADREFIGNKWLKFLKNKKLALLFVLKRMLRFLIAVAYPFKQNTYSGS